MPSADGVAATVQYVVRMCASRRTASTILRRCSSGPGSGHGDWVRVGSFHRIYTATWSLAPEGASLFVSPAFSSCRPRLEGEGGEGKRGSPPRKRPRAQASWFECMGRRAHNGHCPRPPRPRPIGDPAAGAAAGSTDNSGHHRVVMEANNKTLLTNGDDHTVQVPSFVRGAIRARRRTDWFLLVRGLPAHPLSVEAHDCWREF